MTWLAVLVAAVWLAMSATYPFGWDQGIFAWAGGVIVDGGLPYRDAWDLKGPLVYYVYAFAQALFGAGLWSIRLVDAAAVLLGAWGMLRILTPWADRTFARFGAVFCVLWYASFSYWHTAQPDGWTGMLMILATAALFVGTDAVTLPRAAVAGLACGVAALFKPFWLLLLVAAVLPIWMDGPGRRIATAIGLVAGCLIPISVAVGWFAIRGGLDEFWQVHVLDAAAYASAVPVDRLDGLIESIRGARVSLLALPLAGYGAVTLWRSNRRAASFLFAWIVVVFMAVWLQGRFFGYHWLPAMPAVALLAVIGLRVLTTASAQAATIAAVLLLGVVAAPVLYEESRFARWMLGRMPTEAYYDAYGQSGPEMRAVDWMRHHADPGSVFVFGWNPGIAWLTGRTTISRFGFSMPLISGPDDVRRRYLEEALSSLRRDPPDYFIEGDLSARILGREATLGEVPQLAAFVERGYREVARFGAIVIRERKVE